MTGRFFATFVTAAALLALGACSDKKPSANGTAQGQVLEGSVSDAMLPVDTVRSQAPLAPAVPGSDAPAKGSKAAAALKSLSPDAARAPDAAARPKPDTAKPDQPKAPAREPSAT